MRPRHWMPVLAMLTIALSIPACDTGSREKKGQPLGGGMWSGVGNSGGTAGSGSTGPVTADAHEPNDSFQSPTTVTYPYSESGLTIHTAQDEDFYRFPVSANQTVDVELRFSHAAGDIDVVLANPSGQIVALADSTTDDEVISYQVNAAGDYTLKVDGVNGATNRYEMILGSGGGSGGGGPLAADSKEPNDTASNATYIYSWPYAENGLTIHDASDEDHFAFDLGSADTVTAELTYAASNGELEMEILDLQGSVVATASGSPGQKTIQENLSSGGYVVRVAGVSGSTNSYDLLVATQGTMPLSADANEPNDDAASATTIASLPHAEQDLTIHTSSDEDFFAFSIGQRQQVTCTITFTDDDGDLDMSLETASGQPVDSAMSVSDDEEIQQDVDAGDYVLRVYGYGGDDNAYDLDITTSSPSSSSLLSDVNEPNDDASSATQVSLPYDTSQIVTAGGTPFSLHDANDVDFYEFTVSQQGQVSIDFTYDNQRNGTYSDIDLELLDDAGNVVSSSTSTSSQESIQTSLAPGTYTLRIFWHRSSSDGNDYDLTIQ